jgi:large subunit ribosomal protein L18
MARTDHKLELRRRRHARVRKRVQGSASRPRLAVFRSNKHISGQLIDDDSGHTLAAASSTESALRDAGGGNVESAHAVGALLAVRAREAGITTAVFDRGGFAYHGRVAALAHSARAEGLEF